MNADHGRMVLDRGEVPVRWVGRVSICVLIGLVVGLGAAIRRRREDD